MNSAHQITRAVLPAAEVGDLRAGDHTGRRVRELSFADVLKDGEPSDHLLHLVEDINRRGVMHPVLVRETTTGRVLVDGIHRALLRRDGRWPLPADVVHCNHPDDQPCPTVNDLLKEHHHRAVLTGWAWERSEA